MGEMNNCDNAYSPQYCSGRSRGENNTQAAFIKSWRRMVIVLRGGPIWTVNARLQAQGLPVFRGPAVELASPRVSFVWSPMTGGSPMIASLAPSRFWPGSGYVDWVGTSFYSRYPRFDWLSRYYHRFAVRYGKPFVFAEWAVWGGDNAGFVRSFFAWSRSHPRTRMMIYNGGSITNGPFRLNAFPRARMALRAELRSSRYLTRTSENGG